MAAALALLAAAPAPAAPNLFPNPGLGGTASAAAGWNVNTQRGEVAYRRLASGGPDGSPALEVAPAPGPPPGFGRWWVEAFLVEGAAYMLTVQCRTTPGATADIWFPEHFQLEVPAGAAWARQTARFRARRTGSQRMYFQGHGAGSVLFAHPSIAMVGPAPPTSGEPVPASGGAIAGIVVGDLPDPAVYACALDLRRVFAAATGKRARVSARPGPGRNLFIGAAPASLRRAFRALPRTCEAALVSVGPREIVCAGRTPRGTYYAVQDLLRRIGYRSIWPGALGECLPPPGPIRLPARLCAAIAPEFAMRGGVFAQVEAAPGEKLHHVDTVAWIDWAARNQWNRWKASYSQTWDYGVERGGEWQEVAGHTVTETLVPATEFAAHPDWFALVKGKRLCTHPIGTVAEPCVSNPAVIDHVTAVIREFFRTHPRAKRYSIGANDEPSYWCECAKCRALDPTPQKWSRNGQGTLALTDRWLWFVNTVAARIDREFPGRWIGTFAYGSSRDLPVRRRPRRNVMIEFTAFDRCTRHRFLDPRCPINAGCVTRLRAWRRISAAISMYSYLDYSLSETPQACMTSDVDFYRSIRRLGVRYIADEVDTTPMASPALLDLRARLFWDLRTTRDAALKAFCRAAYGPAARTMAAFWALQDRAVTASPTPHPTQNDLARFSPAMIAASTRLLDAAAARSLTPDERARVERARVSILFARYYREQRRLNAQGASGWAAVSRLREEIIGIARKYGFALNLGGYQALGGTFELPMAALEGRTLAALPDQWLLRTDPEAKGERERWFEPSADLTAFRPISTSSNWERQWVGDYDGYAWYALEAVIPPTDAAHVWMLFGAVDETWDLWLDGVHVGASTGDPGEIWDKPAAAEITGRYRPGQRTHIVVRVHDTAGAGGIWKPVRLTVSD